MTEVILKSKVENLGAEADVVKVRPGYARNYLYPRGLAMPATALFKQQIETLRRQRAEREAQELNEANTLAARINKMTITFQMQAAKGAEKIFGSVTSADIHERLTKEGVTVDKRRIKLAHALKEVAAHQVEIVLHTEVTASLKIVLQVPKVEETEEEIEAREKEAKKSARPRRPRREDAAAPATES